MLKGKWLSIWETFEELTSLIFQKLVQVASLVTNFGKIENQEFLGKNGPQACRKRFMKGRYLDIGATLWV